MTRWILLGLDDDEVDVISRIPRETAPADVVVYHPDPEALVLQLAELAELTRVETPPELHADDVVVLGAWDPGSTWAEACRRVGARVVESRHLASTGGAEEGESRAGGPPAWVGEGPRRDGEEALPHGEPDMNEGQPEAPGAIEPERIPTGGELEPEGPAPEIWADPEATFRWALTAYGCPGAGLWWDGDADTWVSWIHGSPVRQPAGGEAPEGWELPTRWGRFVITGIEEGTTRLPPGMFRRFAEDLALRDLTGWREVAARLDTLRPVSREADLLAWGPWFEEALPVFAPSAALLWTEQGDAWRLARAWGEGVGLAGELRLPRTVFEATFAGGSPWRSWDVVRGLKILFIPSPERSRWPLDQARLARLARSGAPE